MSNEDLFSQQTCPRCGGSFAKAQSFCPHCGYIQEESWWEKLIRIFRPDSSAEAARATRGNLVSFLIGLAVSGFFVYQALKTESIQNWLLALFSLIMAFRAWFASPKPTPQTEEGEAVEVEHHPSSREEASSPTAVHFYCENCGTEVAADATACPKCGMKFGE
jgi:RNA polymerase subunit RPABC4/transcription elongation factor Spt4